MEKECVWHPGRKCLIPGLWLRCFNEKRALEFAKEVKIRDIVEKVLFSRDGNAEIHRIDRTISPALHCPLHPANNPKP